MTKKKKMIMLFVITAFIMLMGILVGLYVANNSKKPMKEYSQTTKLPIKTDINNSLENLTDVQKEIIGIDINKIEEDGITEENYSDLYKEFQKLPEEDKEKNEVIPRKHDVPFEKLEEIKENLKDNTKNDNQIEQEDPNKIPAKFNLADKIDIKVENQGNYGLCWDFASIKSLETHLALNNLGNYDLSEMHLNYVESDLMYGNRPVHHGGTFNNFEKYIVETGVVLESEVPYREYTEEEYNKFTEIKKTVEVTETVNFPSIYKSEYSNYTEEEINEFRDTVKKHIMKNGGLYCVIATPDPGTKYFNTSTSSECFLGTWDDLPKGREIHAVTIVGWDDNYPKENFNEGMRPQNDGAYIILNSWGTGYGNSGYYYFSYEDRYVESQLSGIVSTSMDSTYKISSIKSQAIKNYLINNFGHLFIKYEDEDYITKSILSNVYSLDLSNNNMTSLDGIEMFTNLYNLNLSNNMIEDIAPITKLTNLSSIDLSNNNITDISCLSNMKSKTLYEINLSNNKIKDVSAINDIKQDYALSLNISGNLNVKGYDKLNNIYVLNISNCNIKDVSSLNNCEKLINLNVSNNPGIIGLNELSNKIGCLNISDCDLDAIPELNENISYLNISNNNITSLEGIQNFKKLYNLNISGNLITDWSYLKEMNPMDTNQNYEYYEDRNFIANDCNIEDITIFNDFEFSDSLDLKNNKIKDVSNFNNKNIYNIDLSNNKDIKGLQGLNTQKIIYLNDCNISDIEEILKLENVSFLCLENNNLKDITKLSNLKNLENLSLAGNKELNGTITSEKITSLNLSDCNLDNNFDFSKLLKLSYLNISKNPKISNVKDILKVEENEYKYISLDELDFEEFEKIKDDNEQGYLYIDCETLIYNLPNTGNKIDLSKNKILKREFMKNMANGGINIKNGRLDKNGYVINIEDINKDSVEIKFINGYTCFSDSTLKIVFNSSVVEEKIDTNPINNNVISNTLNNNSISNTINENTSVQNYLNNVNFNRVMP